MSTYTPSKYRNLIAGENVNPSFDDISFTKCDSTLVAVNQHLIALVTEYGNGGTFICLPVSQTGRVSHETPKICAHAAEIIDLKFYPFATNILATGAGDGSIKLWELPLNGLTKDIDVCLTEISGYQRKVTCILWHPTTENILFSSGIDNFLFAWNVSNKQLFMKINVGDAIVGLSANYDGSRLALTTRGKKLITCDPRKDEIIASASAHEGTRVYAPVYLKNGLIFTCGTSKNGDREFAMWDPISMDQPLKRLKHDNNRGQMMPHYLPEHGLVIILGKGETVLSVVEIYSKTPYFSTIASLNLTTGGGMKAAAPFPEIALDFMACEIAGIVRVNNSRSAEIIKFKVPRKVRGFQDDLFGEIRASVPSQSDAEYLNGSNKAPKMLNLKTLDKSHKSSSNCKINLKVQSETKKFDLEAKLEELERRIASLEKNR